MLKASSFPEGIINSIKGECLVLQGDDIDTDRIIPARFLKCVNFQALGKQVFADDRNELKGTHPFDKEENRNGKILIVNDNFGCGSSREHAPQALMRWGIRGLIGQSFAEIFYGNCLALGIPCATAPKINIEEMQSIIQSNPSHEWDLNLSEQLFKGKHGSWGIKVDKGPLEMFLSGSWDATSQLIAQNKKLNQVENNLPYLNNFE